MKLKKAKPALPPVETGVYIGVCVGVIGIGEQYSSFYKKYKDEVLFIWDLPYELAEIDGTQKPRQLSKRFTNSMGKNAKIVPFLKSWTGKVFTEEDDLFDLIGKACQLNAVLNDTGEYTNVESAIPLARGTVAPTTSTEPITFDVEDWDDNAFEKLPEWIQNYIKKSTQYQQTHVSQTDVAVQPHQTPTGGAPF